MAAIMKAYREYWDEMLAVGIGVVVTDVAGNTVKGFVAPWLEKTGLAAWADPISEFAIGLGLVGVAEMLIPVGSKYKIYGRLAAFGATAVAIADVIAIAMGMVPVAARPTPRPAVRPTPRPARPVVRPAVRPAPARPAAVTVLPRPAAPAPAPALKYDAGTTYKASPKAPKIFGS